MVYELKEENSLSDLLEKIKKRNKELERKRKTLADIYGKLKWDVDGLEYQKAVRSEWD